MRTLQQTIDAIIGAGLYPNQNSDSSYMCNAANSAVFHELITEKERDALVLSIGLYIANVTGEPGSRTTMQYTLWRTTFGEWCKSTNEELLKLYKDWNNRPRWDRRMRRL